MARHVLHLIQRGWAVGGGFVEAGAILLLATLATLKLGQEYFRLLFESGITGAIDLRNFQDFTTAWFAGRPVYREFGHAPYPPASFAFLYPLVGWLDFDDARSIWAVTSGVALVWLSVRLVAASAAVTTSEKILAALLLPAMNATGVTIGNAQLGLHVLAVLVLAVTMPCSSKERLTRYDLAAAGLFAVALVKPSISAPFVWLVLFAERGFRRVLLAACGYLVVTWLALQFQTLPLHRLVPDMLANGRRLATTEGYANLDAWSVGLGMSEWAPAASILVLVGLGGWIWAHRSVDFWLRLGVTAIVARLWMYHWHYDDLLIVLPMIALFRIAKTHPQPNLAVAAGALLALNVPMTLLLARWLDAPSPLGWIFVWGHPLVWVSDLLFLAYVAARQR